MQSDQYPAPTKPSRGKGIQAVVGASIAVIGTLAAANPQSAVLKALNDAAPQLAVAVPTVVAACGAIIAAFSSPPRLSKRGGGE